MAGFPAKSTAAYNDADCKYTWHHLTQHQAFANKPPMIVVEGKGLRLRDINGNEYLDATSGGVWCVNVGYGRESIAKAVYDQMLQMPYFAATASSIPMIELGEKLISYMPGLGKMYLSNSGSEANEKAYKIVRSLAHITGKTEKKKILYRDRDYHGTTIGALSSSGQNERRDWFGPFVDGFVSFPHACCYRCAFNKEYPSCDLECARAVEGIIQAEGPETVGGCVVETITAGGGVIPPVPEYYDVLQGILKKYDIKLIMDEVVCGIGRTGAMFGYQHYGITPDMVTLAKGVASAYMPLSITVTTEDIFSAFVNDPSDKMAYFRDISTYGGCAAACSAALENIRIIEEEKLLDRVTKMGEMLMAGLEELRDLPGVGDVRGKGLLCGVEFVADKKSKEPLEESKVVAIVGEMAAAGVLIGRTNRCLEGMNNTINMAPAYVVTEEEIATMLKALRASILKVLG